MFSQYSRAFLFLSLSALSPQNVFAGGDTPVQSDPCDDINIVLSNKKHPNPMFEEFHLNKDPYNAINNVFYAVQEGRVVTKTINVNGKTVELKYAEIPVYGWFEYTDGYDYLTVFERQDFFNVCGYVGSTCNPVTYFKDRKGIAPARKWIPWQEVCRELDNPRNGPGVKRKILRQIREENLYGLLRRKGLPDDIAFLDKYSPYVYRDDTMSDEEWMSLYDSNGYPVRRNSTGKPAPKTVLNPYIKRDPKAVEILDPGLASLALNHRQYREEASDFTPNLSPGRAYNPDRYTELMPPPADSRYRILPMENAPIESPERSRAEMQQNPPRYQEFQDPVENIPQYKPAPSSPQPKSSPTAPQVPPTSDYIPEEEEQLNPPVPAPRKEQPQAPKIGQSTPPLAPPSPAPPKNPDPQVKPQTSATSGNIPTAKKVPGKPGFVYSPFESDKMIDVRDFPSGQKVRDPGTQGIFIVP